MSISVDFYFHKLYNCWHLKGKTNMKKSSKRRANGNGTLERRKNGVYLARWTVDGVHYSKSTCTTIYRDAEKRLEEFVKPFKAESKIEQYRNLQTKIGIIQDEIASDENSQTALKMADALDAFFKSPATENMSVGARKCYTDMYHRLMRFVNGYKAVKIVEVRQFTAKMADEFLAELKQNTKTATYNHYLSFMKRLWRVVGKEARMADNPWEGYKKHSGKCDSRANLTTDEVRKVISSVEGEMKTLFYLGYYTSLRIGDCCNIKGKNINLAEGVITIVPQKTCRSKPEPIVIPIHADLARELADKIPDCPDAYVLPDCAWRYRNGTINHRVRKVFQNCGIVTDRVGEHGRKVCLKSFHSLRSGFITMAAQAKIPFPVISAISGHSSLKMCHHYYRTSKENLVECVNAMPPISGEEAQSKGDVVVGEDVRGLLESVRNDGESIDDCIRRLAMGGVKAKNSMRILPTMRVAC